MRFALRRPAARPVSPRGHRPPGGDVPILWTGLPDHPGQDALGETTERLLLGHLRAARPVRAKRRPALDAPSTTTEITRRERRTLPGRPAGIAAPRGR
jgi:hypothetical protein